MSILEAIEILSQADPQRTFFVEKEARYYGGKTTVEYCVSALPGVRGSNCDIVKSAQGFDEPVAQMVALLAAAATKAVATPNDE